MANERNDRLRNHLAAHPLFSVFSGPDLERLSGQVRLRRVAAGDFLFATGTSPEQSFLALSGRFKITAVGPRGNELLLGIVEPGDLAGFVAPIDIKERFVNAVALKNSEVISIDRRHLMPIFERSPTALIQVIAMMAAHLRQAVDICQNIGLLDSQSALWSRLMNLSGRYGRPIDRSGGLRIDHGLSQEDLASSIGVTRVVVNRIFRVWRDEGLVVAGRGYIEILQPDRLKERVLNSPGAA